MLTEIELKPNVITKIKEKGTDGIAGDYGHWCVKSGYNTGTIHIYELNEKNQLILCDYCFIAAGNGIEESDQLFNDTEYYAVFISCWESDASITIQVRTDL